MQDFQNLEVWQRSHQIVLAVYRLTHSFPYEERFGLSAQIRRSAASVASNIAEGCGRQSDADFRRVLYLAMGSACELEYQLILSHDLHYIDGNTHSQLAGELVRVKKMLTSLISRLQPTPAGR
jgi:four helix bundle protein